MSKNELSVFSGELKNSTIYGNNALFKVSDNGVVKSVLHKVELSMKAGHIWDFVQNVKVGNEWTQRHNFKITSEGQEYLNRFAGLKVLHEPKFCLGGKEYQNPHIEFDEYGKKSKAMYQCTVYGLGPDGKNYTSRVIVVQDVADAFISEMMNKIKKSNVSIGFLCPKVLQAAKQKDNPNLVFYDVDNVVSIAIDLSKDEVMQAYLNYQNSKENMEKKIQTIGKRNAMRKHPAMAYYSLATKAKKDDKGNPVDRVAIIDIVSWMNVDEDDLEIKVMSEMKDYEGEVIDVSEDNDDVDADDDNIEIYEEIVIEESEERNKFIEYIKGCPFNKYDHEELDLMTEPELKNIKLQLDKEAQV